MQMQQKLLKKSGDLTEFLFIFSACLSVSLLIVSNIAAVKLWNFFDIAMLDGGIVTFPLAFVLSDMILEIWGKKRAKYIIYAGFILNCLVLLFLSIVKILPAGAGWEDQAAFEAIFGFLPRVVLASLISYLIAQLLNASVFMKIKEKTGQKWFFARSLGSSVVANVANSLVFCGIAFGGVISMGDWWAMVLTSCLMMIMFEIMLTPLNYWVTGKMRKVVLGA